MLWGVSILLLVLQSMVFTVSGSLAYLHNVSQTVKGDIKVSNLLSKTRGEPKLMSVNRVNGDGHIAVEV